MPMPATAGLRGAERLRGYDCCKIGHVVQVSKKESGAPAVNTVAAPVRRRHDAWKVGLRGLPELPEVETTRRGIERVAMGRQIVQARILTPKMLKPGVVATPEEFCSAVVGSVFQSFARRGKYLIFSLESGYHLLFHLKMRGHMVAQPSEASDGKYLALALSLDSGVDVRFYDIWTWGEFRLLDGLGLEGHSALVSLGAEPLTEDFSDDAFAKSLKRRPRTTIKAALLDQSMVAGVGNIYADESLFRAGIRPHRLVVSLSSDELGRLRVAIQHVLSEAVGDGGTVSDNYFDAEGKPGRYEPQVYDRGGEPCLKCGGALVRTRITGRGTVYCAACQS